MEEETATFQELKLKLFTLLINENACKYVVSDLSERFKKEGNLKMCLICCDYRNFLMDIDTLIYNL
jgi:hypothetical protein